jgi:tetratricopeptide (TPR) repeat protein
MVYRPKEKQRSPGVTFLLYTALIIFSALLIFLVSIYVGYLEFNVPTLADRYAPTPTPTRAPVFYIADGDSHSVEGDLEQAIANYEQAIALDPSNDIPYIRQSRLLIYTRDTSRAVARGAQAVLLNPTSAENLAYYCRALDWDGLYDQAFSACSCAAEIDPNYAESYAFISEVYSDLGDGLSARTTAQQALDANFQSMDAHHNMGYALETLGRYEEAVDYYENAVKLAPMLAPAYVSAGRAYFNLGDYGLAEERFKQAIKLLPFDPEAYFQLGYTYYSDYDLLRAIDALEQSVGVDPTYVSIYPAGANAWGLLGMSYYRRQNYERTVEFLPKAIELSENQLLKRAREFELLTQIETLTGPDSVPILRGRFLRIDGQDVSRADLKPVSYYSNLAEEQAAEAGESSELPECAASIMRTIQQRISLPGLQDERLLTYTDTFSRAGGTATIEFLAGKLILDIENLPQPEGSAYEIRLRFWPERTESLGLTVPDENRRIYAQLPINQRLTAPLEYYYTMGLAYVNLRQCQEAEPWLLRSLEQDGSVYNPAWYGVGQCADQLSHAPPTPLPTYTPAPGQ